MDAIHVDDGDDRVTVETLNGVVEVCGSKEAVKTFALDVLIQLHDRDTSIEAILPNLSL